MQGAEGLRGLLSGAGVGAMRLRVDVALRPPPAASQVPTARQQRIPQAPPAPHRTAPHHTAAAAVPAHLPQRAQLVVLHNLCEAELEVVEQGDQLLAVGRRKLQGGREGGREGWER
jgi:hypothetical protein